MVVLFGRMHETCNAAKLAMLVEALKFLLQYDQLEGGELHV